MTKSINKKLFRQEEHEYSYILMNEHASRASYYFDIKLSRGLSIIQQRIAGKYCEPDLIKVRTADLYEMMKRIMNNALLDVCTTCGVNDTKDLKVLHNKLANPELNEFSFTSYGATTLNKLSLLIDLYKMTSNDTQGKRVILTLVEHILTDIVFELDKADLLDALQDRYKHEPKNLALDVVYDSLKGGSNA